MEDINRKRKIAMAITIVALANLWASIACDVPNVFAKGAFVMVTVILIGITIERWARFLKIYIDKEIEKKIKI